VSSCIRCYKSCHSWKKTEGDVEGGEEQCFDLQLYIPITSEKFICVEHIEKDVKTILDSEQILNQHQVISLHNQMKNCERPMVNDVNIKQYRPDQD
jgi:hypothetical protein